MRSIVMMRYSQKPPVHRWASSSGGNSLIEVMLAVALMAVTALALIAGQLWSAREARAMAMREHAAWIADSMAEAARTPAALEAAIRQWNVGATTLLPHGEASVGDNAGVATARVTWASVRDMPSANEGLDKPESCGGVDIPAGTSCVALAFAK
jgi:Tfp pilus assembly protein PilV